MLQAVMIAPGKIEYRQVEKPTPAGKEVLVKTKNIGVCGSDIHVYHGIHPYTKYPVVQGHEVSGEVAEIGAQVRAVAPGDKVTFMPQVTCGTCYPCTHGMYHICDSLKVMGFQTSGAAQEYFLVPEAMLIKLPPNFSYEAGAMIEPVAVAVHAIGRAGEVVAGKKIMVLGAGPIGNLVGQVAKGLGAAAVLITDLSDFRLAKAKACGLDFTVNTKQEDLATALTKHFGPDRADLILECVGAEATIGQALTCARKGTTIVIVGVCPGKVQADLAMVQNNELSLIGTLMYQKKDYEQAVALASAGKLCLEPLVTDRFPLQAYLQAYQHIQHAGDQVMKVMIAVD
jgi:L-iditol 2-dehydrogenase